MSDLGELQRKIYIALKNGELDRAEELSVALMEEDISAQIAEPILQMVKFWQNRSELFHFSEDENNGEKLFLEWDKFLDFCVENKVENKRAFFAVKAYVYGVMIELLIEEYKLSPVKDRELLITLGQAFYEAGMNEKAVETLEYARTLAGGDAGARVFTLLGDLYAENGDEELAQVMYSEAFLRHPQEIVLKAVDFAPVKKLSEMVIADGFSGNAVAEWVPVYGYLYGGLTVRKKLEYEDYMSLVELIKEYETSLKLEKSYNIIIPRLVNYYFWVFDYYFYQVKAKQGARKVARRVFELLGAAEGKAESVNKIAARAEALMKEFLNAPYDDQTSVSKSETGKK